MDDLDAVAVGILEIAGPGAVAMRARLRVENDAAALEKAAHRSTSSGGADDQPEMIERSRRARPARRARARERRERCSARLSCPSER